MNKQTGSVLAILLGVGILFAAATDRVGAAISALRGSPVNAGDTTSTPDSASGKGDTKQTAGVTDDGTGVTKSLAGNGTTRFTQTAAVRT